MSPSTLRIKSVGNRGATTPALEERVEKPHHSSQLAERRIAIDCQGGVSWLTLVV